jgi:hypothetical protein
LYAFPQICLDAADMTFLYQASNIEMAVKACTQETGNVLQNREQMQQVRESLNEGYCDISGRVGDLIMIGSCFLCGPLANPESFIGKMGDVKIYTSRGNYWQRLVLGWLFIVWLQMYLKGHQFYQQNTIRWRDSSTSCDRLRKCIDYRLRRCTFSMILRAN